jgi:hypothetical protein
VPLNNTGFNAAAKPLTENYLSGFCIVRKLGKFLLNLVHECSNKLVMTYIYIYSILLSVNQTREPVNKKRNMKVYPAEGPVLEAPVTPFPSFIMMSCSM